MRHFKSIVQGFQARILFALLVSAFSTPVFADGGADLRYAPAAQTAAVLQEIEIKKAYALGIGRYDLDTHTEVIGWRFNESWFFGRQDGLDSGLTLVWQLQGKQVSFSKDGVRLTRRF